MLTSVLFSSGTWKSRFPVKVQIVLEHRTCFFLNFPSTMLTLGNVPKARKLGLLIWPCGTIDESGEIMDLVDVVVRAEERKKSLQIQPLVIPAPNRPVVEVEAINVNNGSVRHTGRKTKKKGNHIDCPNRHWFAGESYKSRLLPFNDQVKGIIESL